MSIYDVKLKNKMKKTIILFAALSLSANMNAQNYWKKGMKQGKVILTSQKSNEKFASRSNAVFTDFPQPKETDICVFVDPDFKYQKIIGFGGAIQMLLQRFLQNFQRISKRNLLKLITENPE